jgi:pimeloyl-ACP methyl ester carboxylesterase
VDESDLPPPYPGARAPDRQRRVMSAGLSLAVHEWGDEGAPPLLLAHGGFDFARTFEVFAPLLAAGGWRAVSWDHRGHGDSEHSLLTSWDSDVRDASAILEDLGPAPVPMIGHSKGGGLLLRLAAAWPHRVSALVNIDGLPSRRRTPDVANTERSRLLAADLSSWLDHRRRTATAERRAGTLDELAARRGRMNPRLDMDWLRHLVTVGGRHDPDGWRWKLDPSLRMGGFGPWRPEWSLHWLPGLPMPFLGFLGLEPEPMGWGMTPDAARAWMPRHGRLETFENVGHFVHIEAPQKTAAIVLDFLGPPAPTRRVPPHAAATPADDAAPRPEPPTTPRITHLRHNRARLALHLLRDGDGPALLLLHGLGGRTPLDVPDDVAAWPGPITGLDLTGHGASDLTAGGGFTAEVLLGDVDTALAALGPATLVGRGLGAYLALLAAGARPALVLGALLDDGPGLDGGGPGPGSPVILQARPNPATPDAWALLELASDVRPPDYALSFAHQAVHQSDLATPLWVAARSRPPWLEAVASEPGVEIGTFGDGLAALAAGRAVGAG